MGRTKVIEILLEHAGKSLGEMIRICDGTGMTGFMLACRWNKTEVVQTLIGSSIGKSDVYEGFMLACQHQKKKIIEIILQRDEFRKHIMIEEIEKGNVIRMHNGKTEIRQKIEWANQNQEMVISFDEYKKSLDIEINFNSTLNKSEAEKNDDLGDLGRCQLAGPSRPSLNELALKNLVKNAPGKSHLKELLNKS